MQSLVYTQFLYVDRKITNLSVFEFFSEISRVLIFVDGLNFLRDIFS